MNRILWRVFFAPDRCGHGTALAANADNVVLIASRTLDGGNVESKYVAMLVRTCNMDRSTTVMAGHACAALRLADFADFLVSSPGDGRNAFARLERFCTAKFHLGGEDSTGDVDPVLIRSPLQRLSGIKRSTQILLTFSIEVGSLDSQFLVLPLAFAFLLGLLLVRNLRRFHEVMNGGLDRTQDALVVLILLVSTGQSIMKSFNDRLTREFCGLLSLVHVSQIHLPIGRLSITP